MCEGCPLEYLYSKDYKYSIYSVYYLEPFGSLYNKEYLYSIYSVEYREYIEYHYDRVETC